MGYGHAEFLLVKKAWLASAYEEVKEDEENMQTIFLEFKHEAGNIAANGTDVIFYIDGRWSWNTTREKIEERVSALRNGPRGSAYSKQQFVGFTYSQQPYHSGKGGAIHTMRDPNPPLWCYRPATDEEIQNWLNGYQSFPDSFEGYDGLMVRREETK